MVRNKRKLKSSYPIEEYKIEISFVPEDRVFVARVPELPGCVTHGESPEQALKMGHEAIFLYLDSLKRAGKPVPVPLSRKKFSGNIPLRIDPSLHRDIAVKADTESLSLNRYIEKILRTA